MQDNTFEEIIPLPQITPIASLANPIDGDSIFMEGEKIAPKNRGKRWSKEDEEKLLHAYVTEERGVDDIAKEFERTSFAIICRLVYLKVISDESNIRGYDASIPSFERTVALKGTNQEMTLPSFIKREKLPKAPKVKKPRAPKPLKEKKEKKERAPKVSHKKPTYRAMILKALNALAPNGMHHDDNIIDYWGSRTYIKKYLETNYNAVNINMINRTISRLLELRIITKPEGRDVYSVTSMNLPFPEKKKEEFLESHDFSESTEEEEYSLSEDDSDDEYKPSSGMKNPKKSNNTRANCFWAPTPSKSPLDWGPQNVCIDTNISMGLPPLNRGLENVINTNTTGLLEGIEVHQSLFQ